MLSRNRLWRRLPLELQSSVLAYVDTATVLRLQDLTLARSLVQRELPTAPPATQQTWWAAVLETGWLAGARMLLDECAPYLPAVDADQGDKWADSPELLQLLVNDGMIATWASKTSDTVDWGKGNCTTLFSLVRRLAKDNPLREPLLRALWNVTPKYHAALYRVLADHCDTSAMEQLTEPSERPRLAQEVALQYTRPDARSTPAARTWIRDHLLPELDATQFLGLAARWDDVPMFAKLYDRLTADQIMDSRPLCMALFGSSFGVLRWLHANVRVVCSAGCVQFTTTADHLPCDPLPNDQELSNYAHLFVVKWLHQHHPHAVTEHFYTSAAIFGCVEVLQWLRAHRPDILCPAAALELALRCGNVAVVETLMPQHPELQAAINSLIWTHIIPDIASRDDVATLDWLLVHYPAAFEPDFDYFLSDSWAPHALEWVIDHPRFAPWTKSGESIEEWVAEYFDTTAGEAGYDSPLAPRSLYHRLAPTHDTLPELRGYFVRSAIDAGDTQWLQQITFDYDCTIDEVCHGMDTLYAAGRLDMLRKLVADGLQPTQDMVVRCVDMDNLVGARWLVISCGVRLDCWSISNLVRAGCMGVLQVLSTVQTLCLEGIKQVHAVHQPHIVRWCDKQPPSTWETCSQHAE
ncbi:hypothetical protein RI367_008269 [Sorochytrium milnesiophthora]